MDLNYSLLLKISGLVLVISGIGMIPSIICALFYDETGCFKSFFICSIMFMLLGFVIFRKFNDVSRKLRIRDGYIIVASCWVLSCIFGSIPYYFSGVDLTITQSLFEATAGFTTTGASTIVGETAPRSLLLYRSVTHWLGGMGILVLAVSILPALGIGGQNLAKAEMPSPRVDKISNRISDSTRILYIMYFLFTILEFLMLSLSDRINTFEALVNTLSTISTGGLMTHTTGLAFYKSAYIETVITCFSFLVAINFNLYYFIITGKIKEFFGNAELKFFTLIIVLSSFFIALNLYSENIYNSFPLAVRHALTQVLSFASTSGFSFADFNSWPMFSKMILFILMFTGGCAASTSGGIKTIRVMVLYKLIKRGFRTRIHPRSVVAVKIGKDPLKSSSVTQITSFILMYIFIFFIGCILLSLDATDITTDITTVASVLSNTGINFGDFDSYAVFSPFSQMVMVLLMLIGRLELFTILILFTPAFWNPNRQKG